MAVIQADLIRPGITIPFAMATNVANEVFDVIDQGQPCNAGQVLAGHGFPTSTHCGGGQDRDALRGVPGSAVVGADRLLQGLGGGVHPRQHRRGGHLNIDGPWRAARLNVSTMVALQWLVVRHSGCPERWDDFRPASPWGELEVGRPAPDLAHRDVARHSTAGRGQPPRGVLKTWNGYAQKKRSSCSASTRRTADAEGGMSSVTERSGAVPGRAGPVPRCGNFITPTRGGDRAPDRQPTAPAVRQLLRGAHRAPLRGEGEIGES